MPKKTSVIKASDSDKAWNRKKKNKMPYHIESIAKKKAFLIICEGKNTEPEYFKSFPVIEIRKNAHNVAHNFKAD